MNQETFEQIPINKEQITGVDFMKEGDIVGLPDSGGVFKIGDTLTEGENIHFRGLPSFSPELFKYIENDDPMKSKQFQKGIEQFWWEAWQAAEVDVFSLS